MLTKVLAISALLAPRLGASTPWEAWEAYEPALRDGKLTKDEARGNLTRLWPAVLNEASARAPKTFPKFAFPVETYIPRQLKHDKKSYAPVNFSFFDGNRHGGHPALDLFIEDRDQDCRQDSLKRPAKVFAVAASLVLSVNNGWKPGSDLRGGNYAWLYEPGRERLWYYAHLLKVEAKPGQWLEAGQIVGTLGRSGKNAHPRRSPTHLHLMCLRYDGWSEPRPLNPAKLLEAAWGPKN